MSLTAAQLKSKWEREKKDYTKAEVGSGVQKFVKDLLKSGDFFNLKEGLVSTSSEKRKREFTEESKTKAARRADIIIYINSDIIIPMEVEKYGNIEAGLDQLFQYQLDLDKKYGVLTDGFTWRFYNNAYLIKEFSLDEIFADTGLFKEFWREYVKPEFYYLSFFEERGQLKILPEDLSVEKRRQDFFRDITTLISGFKNKLKIEGYFQELEQKERAKRAIEITYAYIIQFVLYKTLVDNDFDDYESEYQKKVEKIYESLKKNDHAHILGIINGISDGISKNIYKPFSKEQKLINQKLLDLFHSVENNLHDVSPWLDIFVFIKKYNFANVKNDIFGYIYENYLKELYEETQKGQYFTDPAIVNFMLEQIGYTSEMIKTRVGNKPDEDHISIIDPSCGSGTFLYNAVDRLIEGVPDGTLVASQRIEELINNNIFGLDIAEFPLYLAEMNILMRMLPLIINEKYNNPIDKKIKVFLTKDSIAEFINAGLRNTINDLDVAGQHGQASIFDVSKKIALDYSSYVRDEGDLTEMKASMRPPRRRFNYVIGNPPYISYNECSKQGVLIFQLFKKGEAKLNNIYGVNLHSIPDNRKKYSPKPNLYAFFIALGLSLLKDNGKLCYIIPQTLLTAGDLDVLRYHLSKFTTIEKIITFSGRMFVGRGIKQNKPVPTSSLIFVIRRIVPGPAHQVEVVHYKDPNDDVEKCLENISLGKKISKKKILQSKFLQNVANWNFIKQDKSFLDFYEEYKNRADDIVAYYNHVLAEQKFGNRFYFDKGLVFPKNAVKNKEDVAEGTEHFGLIKLDKNKWSVDLTSKIIEEKNVKIPHGSQGLGVFKQKYKIIWSYMNYDHFYFVDKNVMINFNFVIITSNNKNELLYLLSLLNSKIIRALFMRTLKSENEKDILVGIKTIKEFVRVPKINEDNQFIKDEIIGQTDQILKLEEVLLSDLVDFSGVTMQKFDSAEVVGSNLILKKEGKEIKCPIKKDLDLVKKVIRDSFGDNKLLSDEKINLSELKSSLVIDFEKQKALKDYIDDLVFTLYFNVPIKKVGFDKTGEIKARCEENKFYKVISE